MSDVTSLYNCADLKYCFEIDIQGIYFPLIVYVMVHISCSIPCTWMLNCHDQLKFSTYYIYFKSHQTNIYDLLMVRHLPGEKPLGYTKERKTQKEGVGSQVSSPQSGFCNFCTT